MYCKQTDETRETVSCPENILGQRMRVVAYVIGSRLDELDPGHLDTVTDIIFFYHNTTKFDSDGNVTITQTGIDALAQMKQIIGERPVRLHIFMQGPKINWGGVDEEYKAAFESGVLETNIRTLLETHQLDGVSFDYEFPDTAEDYENFSRFVVSLKRVLGEDYTLGCAMNASHAEYSPEAMQAMDMIELMSYDYYDENGDHTTYVQTEGHVNTMLEKGYPPEKINLGLPFYARPSDNSAYWYDWCDYYNKVGDSRRYHCPETGKRFYFHDESLVYEKTMLAIHKKLGGMMVWHYTADAPSDSGHALFSAIRQAKKDAGVQ